ncbi:hypothetical protein J2X12_001712 [Pseudarthrobacter oxydans]|uniref:Uncharacterized protein n=1 Tax=Pseudarthrobacter oxydans TaxID=1671 RepID=A0AAW8NBY5_PSEOX|nr:hypothetical protein [Pseudarthrobacter oxydans]MDR6792811.1 hypothetical protein [Pseudarthrobacter oxydans]MDR7163697.1 hypothetical protein [Pseudarthrobacter oxydans]
MPESYAAIVVGAFHRGLAGVNPKRFPPRASTLESRAAQHGHDDIRDAARKLLELMDPD